jgi:hypothetical protein
MPGRTARHQKRSGSAGEVVFVWDGDRATAPRSETWA